MSDAVIMKRRASWIARIVLMLGITVLCAQAQLAPNIFEQPKSVTEAVGGNVAFLTLATTGSYQWRKNNEPLSGATDSTLFLPGITAGQAGNYSCVVTNTVGSVTSNTAVLTVIPSFSAGNVVDLSFDPRALLDSPPRVAIAQPDGKIIIGGSFLLFNEGVPQFGLARLNADGSLDSTFTPPFTSGGYFSTLALLPDGRLLAGGDLAPTAGFTASHVVRISANGAIDPTFRAVVATVPLQVHAFADGRVLVVDGSEFITRLNADGSTDASFGRTPLVIEFLDSQPNGQPVIIRTANARIDAATILPDGKVIVAGSASFYGRTRGPVVSFTLRRLTTAGAEDGTFAAYREERGNTRDIQALRVLAQGRIMVCWDGVARSLSNAGVRDASYSSTGFLKSAAIAADGSVTAFTTVDRGPMELWRLTPEGTINQHFRLFGTDAPADVKTLLPLADGRVLLAGEFTQLYSVARRRLAVMKPAFDVKNRPSLVRVVQSPSGPVRAGEPVSATVWATGSPPLTYMFSGASSVAGNSMMFANPQPTQRGVGVEVTGAGGVRVGGSVLWEVVPSAPFVRQQPSSISNARTRDAVMLSVTVGGNDPRQYQWFKDGLAIPGATGSTYSVARVTLADRGSYTVVVRNDLGLVASVPVSVNVTDLARLTNLSTRAIVGSGEGIIITGFVVAGATPKRFLLRGVGPALERFGVAGFVSNPRLALLNSSGVTIAENDDWRGITVPDEANRVGAFALDDASGDAALVATVSPGNYTVQVASADAGTGVGLVEAYELDQEPGRIMNFSSRVLVGTSGAIAIAGITMQGTAPTRFLIRAIGPGLAGFGVQNVLTDPVLTLVDSTGAIIATNNDWGGGPALTGAFTATGAFPLAAESRDAALLVNLAGGSVTGLVTGANNGTGVALLEVFEVPE